MRSGYCMCVDPKLKDREVVCSIRTYTSLRNYFTGLDYRVHLDEDVEANTVVMSSDLYGMIYQDMLDLLSVKESEIGDDSDFGWSDSELHFSDSCV